MDLVMSMQGLTLLVFILNSFYMVVTPWFHFCVQNSCKPFRKEVFNDTKIRVDGMCFTFEFNQIMLGIFESDFS